jgi:signal transduction histidine kinase
LQSAGGKMADGRLLFPTAKGLVAVNPAGVKINRLPPPVCIEEMRVDDKKFADGNAAGPLKVPPGRHRIEFEYTALSFVTPEKVRFKCRLNNLETETADAGAKRVATYNYIPPGNYSFEVTACNNDGVWNEAGASLKFEMLPYFWQTMWFRALGGLATVLAAGGAVWFDTRRRMRRRLERVEHQRDLERERSRIARDIHDDLGASLTRIAMLSQSDRGEMQVPESVTKNLDHIFATAREVTRAMDEIVWAVNPRHDRLDSLASYLSRFANEYLRVAEIRCRLNLPLHLPMLPVTAEVRHNLFLAFKESLHNVIRHAAAAEVRVSLQLAARQMILTVTDDGCGFDARRPDLVSLPSPDRLSQGNGLPNMKRRLAEIHGTCQIQSVPGQGTTVTFTVPLPV